jgi:dipeptidyl aminopeptidase/acylaminoacyl peptidase
LASPAVLLVATLFAAAPPLPIGISDSEAMKPLLADELEEAVVTLRKPLSLETYMEYPEFDQVTISPGGTRLAMSWTDNDSYVRSLTVLEYPSMRKVDTQRLQQHFGASDLRWAGERWLLVQPDYPKRGFRRARDSVGSLFVVDIERHRLHVLNAEPLVQAVTFDWTLAGDPLSKQRSTAAQTAEARRKRARPGDRGPATDSNTKGHALGPLRWLTARGGQSAQALFHTVGNTQPDGQNTDGHGVFLLDLPDIRTRATSVSVPGSLVVTPDGSVTSNLSISVNVADVKQVRLTTSPMPGSRFVTGPEGRISLASGINDNDEQVVYYLPAESRAAGEAWQLRVTSRSVERGLLPVAWTGNGEEYYALDGREATRSVVVWNAIDNTRRVLYRHPELDMEEFALDPSGKPWIFCGVRGRPVCWYPDAGHPLAQLHRMLAMRLPQERVEVTSASDDLSLAVVRVSSGSRAPVFLVMDVKTGVARTGMQAYPRLKLARLDIVEPIEFRARDGLMLHGYLSTPTDAYGKRRYQVPLVVIAHDGPPGDPGDIRYEYERQLFTSRGYAALQVDHRGTRGRGVAFEQAGEGNWGRKVQEDFADGVRWAIQNGVAAEGHVCFYGTHYGAYSALMASARDPDRFQCVIAAAGVYDLPAMLGDSRTLIPSSLQRAFGNNLQELIARSPVTNAAAIRAKVLLIEQKGDEQVPKEQFSRMRTALRAAGHRPETTSIGSSNDGFFYLPDRAEVYARMLNFLNKTIGD